VRPWGFFILAVLASVDVQCCESVVLRLIFLNRLLTNDRAYWITFIPMRLILYPWLLVRFWNVLEGFPLWERLLVVGCQLLLCCFNYGKSADCCLH
jgi:hypothetical protein